MNLGRELLQQVDSPNYAYCGAVGSAGMLVGVAKALRKAKSSACSNPRALRLPPRGNRAHTMWKVSGSARYHRCLTSNSMAKPAGRMRWRHARWPVALRERWASLPVSTGVDVVAALRLAKELGPVVPAAVDSGLKYLAGDVYAQ